MEKLLTLILTLKYLLEVLISTLLVKSLKITSKEPLVKYKTQSYLKISIQASLEVLVL